MRLQNETAKRHQILYGDVAGQTRAIRSRHWNVAPTFQSARQSIYESITLAHKTRISPGSISLDSLCSMIVCRPTISPI